MNRIYSAFLPTITIFSLTLQSAFGAPTINNTSVPGIQAGTTFQITVTGTDLAPAPKLLASFPIASQKVIEGSDNGKAIIELNTTEVQPGIHWIRIASEQGISNALSIGVDNLPQQPFAESVDALPVALSGDLTGGNILKTTFAGKQGEAIVVDIEGRRIGSNIRPVLRLLDEKGVQVGFSAPQPELHGDARISTTLPGDGSYTLELHDILYKGPAPGRFRLKIGNLSFADLAFPMGIQQGQPASVQYGRTNIDSTVEIAAVENTLNALPLPAVGHATGSRPRIVVSQHVEYVESTEAGDVPAAPVGINGRLSAKGETDSFKVVAKPGSKLRLDVIARRAGSPVDGVLVVKAANGTQIGNNDDRPGLSDPGVDVTVPGDSEFITVSLHDLLRRGGEDFIYRIEIEDISQPQFGVSIAEDRLQIPSGSTQTVIVDVARQGYNGDIALAFDGLPEGVTVAGNRILAGRTRGLVSITAANGDATFSVGRISATAADENVTTTKIATVGSDSPHYRVLPELRQNLGIARAAAAPISASLAATTTELQSPRGKYLPITVNVGRNDGVTGNIRLRLVSNQTMPRKKVKQNNKDVEVNDTDRALRLSEDPMLGADVTSQTVNVWIPHDLGIMPWRGVIVAELLSADNKAVVASVSTAQLNITPVDSLSIAITTEAGIEARAGEGETGYFAGTITRAAGFDKPVTVTLAGLPEGYAAPSIEVPTDQTEFKLEVRFPKEAKPADLKDIKLIANAPTDLKPELKVTSNQINTTIKVVTQE
ncbi:MAG: hypothetical protein CMM06_01510 [Rhodopirellula sp.]|nr:hypothetical protein [Rhodopirellula sp.]|tara:strand:- start:24483 stop:26792 length:2310 start_codon:yes stop_codon:yes gene_type:complete